MNRLPIFVAIVATITIAVIALGTLPSDDGGEDGDQSDGEIFSGPYVNNVDMGSLIPVSGSSDPNDPTITYRAVAREGFQFLYWTDSEGEIISDNPSMTFPAYQDRTERAVFEWGGTRSIEIEWHPPEFLDDGISFDMTCKMNLSLSSFDWDESISDMSIQRGATVRDPSPASLLTNGGVIEAIIGELEPYMEGLTNLQRAMVVLSFVQDAIDYDSDLNLYGTEEFWATPSESLFLGYGDCEDGAILFVSIASAMGMDCGFVTFDSDHAGTKGTGHMSIAVALADGENISGTNTATFIVDGVTYAYGETAVDPVQMGNIHPMFGILGSSYAISDGMWTHITHSESGFHADSTLSIGTDNPTGVIVYGESADRTVHLGVGEMFVYRAEVSGVVRGSYAIGSGMADEGGFLIWNANSMTLSGSPASAGVFQVTLVAYNNLTSDSQDIVLIVSEPSYGSSSEPPDILMDVGDSFCYRPETTIPSTIDASGNGLRSSGGFLDWDAETNTLSGTASESGVYEITLESTSTVGPEQKTYQRIVLIVDSSNGTEPSDHYLVYGDGIWTVEKVNKEVEENENDNRILIVCTLIVTIFAALIIARGLI